jgi:SdpC family antimicrobial peptide
MNCNFRLLPFIKITPFKKSQKWQFTDFTEYDNIFFARCKLLCKGGEKMTLKKGFKLLVAIVVLVATLPSLSFAQTTSKDYSGVELYKGIVFGQGEVGKKIITDKKLYEQMNSEGSKKFVNELVDYIKSQNPSYFDELKAAIDKKDATISLELLQSSGKYFDEYLESMSVNNVAEPDACGLVAVCGAAVVLAVYNYVVVVQAAAAGQVAYAAWALKTKVVNNLTNGTEIPEAEMAKILSAF